MIECQVGEKLKKKGDVCSISGDDFAAFGGVFSSLGFERFLDVGFYFSEFW